MFALQLHINAGHVHKLAEAEAEGAKEVDGVEVTLMQVNGLSWIVWMPPPFSFCPKELHKRVPVDPRALLLTSAAMHIHRAFILLVRKSWHHPARRCMAGAVQFPEILSEEVLAKMHAVPKADIPIATVQDLPNYDGFIMDFPTRCAVQVDVH